MKFKSKDAPNLMVWDAVSNRSLCQFEKGELETNDQRTIDILIGLGYENDGPTEETKAVEVEVIKEPTEPDLVEEDFPETPTIIDVGVSDVDFEALQKEAQSLKVVNWHKKSADQLREAIAAKKAV